MAKTILEIARNAILLAGFDAPTSLLTPSQHYDIAHYRAIIQSVGEDLAARFNWAALLKTYQFTTTPSVAYYKLPKDCSRIAHNTIWDDSINDWMDSPMNIQTFALEQFDPITSGTTYRFAMKGLGAIELVPTPTDAITFKFKYLSTNWIVPIEWQPSISVSEGQYVRYGYNIYTAVGAGTTGSTPPTHTSGSVSDGSVTWAYDDDAYVSIVSDDDNVCVDELALESGIISRIKEGLDQPNQIDEARYITRGKRGFGHQSISKNLRMFGNPRRSRLPMIVDFE